MRYLNYFLMILAVILLVACTYKHSPITIEGVGDNGTVPAVVIIQSDSSSTKQTGDLSGMPDAVAKVADSLVENSKALSALKNISTDEEAAAVSTPDTQPPDLSPTAPETDQGEVSRVEPDDDEVASVETSTTEPLAYDHYNPAAWHGKGSAVVLCDGAAEMDSCEIDGVDLPPHGSMDKGRYVYTAFYTKGLSGVLTCKRGNKTYTTTVKGSGLQHGDC